MVEFIGRLIESGHAYRAEDGAVYFSVASFERYGQLKGIDTSSLRAGARVAQDEYDKEDARDFALWKAATEEDERARAAWDSPWGRGRPGWHLECSVMSLEELGETLDMHLGGEDLIFPHHENEIAQSEASTGAHFVNVWLHNAHLVLHGEKMARRVGNISRPAEVFEDGYSPAMLRYALIATHYRAPLEWGDETLDHARAAVERLSTAVAALESYEQQREDDPTLDEGIESARTRFRDAMDDDLNVSGGLGAVFELVRDLNSRIAERSLSTADARRGAAAIRDFDRVLAVLEDPQELPSGAQELLDQRAAARATRDFGESDRLRDALAALGVIVEDTADGQRWRIGKRPTDG
jgi:cysteinyl-tRNA synthetase